MMGGLPPFTEADFVLSKEKRAEITAGLTPAQAKMVEHWMDLHEVINRGDWDGMDKFFNTDTMTSDNPNRRSDEHTSELQSLMSISYAVYCLTRKKNNTDK